MKYGTFLTCTAATLLLLGGCEKKVGGQVVAVVNGQEITQQELNAELASANVPEGVDRKTVMPELLKRIVERKLLVGKAKEQGLDKSPTYLGQVQRAQDGILIDMFAANIAKSIKVPDAAAADRYIADNPSLFGERKRYALDQIVFPANNDPALAAKLKPTKTLDEIEAVLKSAGIQYQRGNGQLDTGGVPPEIAKKIAALPPGEPFLVPQNGRIVASVIRGAEPSPVPAQQAQSAAIGLLRRQAVDEAVRKQIDQARKDAKIEYEPGFAPKAAPASKPAS